MEDANIARCWQELREWLHELRKAGVAEAPVVSVTDKMLDLERIADLEARLEAYDRHPIKN